MCGFTSSPCVYKFLLGTVVSCHFSHDDVALLFYQKKSDEHAALHNNVSFFVGVLFFGVFFDSPSIIDRIVSFHRTQTQMFSGLGSELKNLLQSCRAWRMRLWTVIASTGVKEFCRLTRSLSDNLRH